MGHLETGSGRAEGDEDGTEDENDEGTPRIVSSLGSGRWKL